MSEEREELIKALKVSGMFIALHHERTDAEADEVLTLVNAALLLAQQETSGWREPEGWKLVPVKPAMAMLNAAIDTDSFKLGDISLLGFRCSPQMMFERAYHAMLAAAPSPPTSQETT